MIDLIVALILAGLVSVWRYFDGGEKGVFREQSVFHLLFLQTTTVACLCLGGGLWAAWPIHDWSHTLPILGLSALVFYLLIRSMPGFEFWLPNRSRSGERRAGMLLAYALPMLLAAGVMSLFLPLTWTLVLLPIAGLLPPVVYVPGTRHEDARKKSGHPEGGAFLIRGRYWTAEELGRLSMGALVFPLPLL